MPGSPSAPSPSPVLAAADAREIAYLADATPVRMHRIDRAGAVAVPDDVGAGIAARDLAGRIVGSATYARVYGPRAEVAIAVDREFWHRGLPEALLADLRGRAARVGIETFLLRVPAADLALLALLRAEFCARETVDGASVHVEFRTSGG